jgi:hypothetical protein
MIRAPRKFNGTFITRHFFPGFFQIKDVAAINRGKCYDWAYIAHRLYGVQLWSTDYHAWVEAMMPSPENTTESIGGYSWKPMVRRYFDSETPKGVSNFLTLGCNRRNSHPVPWEDQHPIRMTLIEFKEFWNHIGSGRRYHWDSHLEPQLKDVLKDRYKGVTPILST